MLNSGYTRAEIVNELDLPADTFRKAFSDGRLTEPKKSIVHHSTKSERNTIDCKAANELGTACTRKTERVAASFGMSAGAKPLFTSCVDVPKGGAICALPSLLISGLLNGIKPFLNELGGYYRAAPILIVLAYMYLCRIKTVEKLRGHSPGEFGKIIGLDRIPEVRCLRGKIAQLGANGSSKEWGDYLGRYWLSNDEEAVGTLYVDGHIRVYHGNETKIPKKFVSRERLCLRGTCDYWINDATGKPFFVIDKIVDEGMLKVLEEEIIPRLLQDLPERALDPNDKYQARFILVFDREGYSPIFFKKMWEKYRIACITYHKYPGEAWPDEEFSKQKVTMPSGVTSTVHLAERGTLIGSGNKRVWVKEIRKLTTSRHQTSIVSTAYSFLPKVLASKMFSRWCQENFFRYMMRHFNFDQIGEYKKEDAPAMMRVVNPVWRKLERERNSIQSKLTSRRARIGAMTVHPRKKGNTVQYEKWLSKQALILEEIEELEQCLVEVKRKKKAVQHHIVWNDLDEGDKFQQFGQDTRYLLNTIKMLVYRAETAMASILTNSTIDVPAARVLLQDLFITEADIFPDEENKILRVRVHNASRPVTNIALKKLFVQLNETETIHPGTDMQIIYELGDSE